MKVVSSPDIVNWKSECNCSTCSSKLEVNADDLLHKVERKYRSGDWPDQGWYEDYDYYYVICPMCSKEVSVRVGDIPYLLKDKTQKKCAKRK